MNASNITTDTSVSNRLNPKIVNIICGFFDGAFPQDWFEEFIHSEQTRMKGNSYILTKREDGTIGIHDDDLETYMGVFSVEDIRTLYEKADIKYVSGARARGNPLSYTFSKEVLPIFLKYSLPLKNRLAEAVEKAIQWWNHQ